MQKIIIVTTKRFDKDIKKLNQKIYNKLKQRIQMFVGDRTNSLLAVHKLHGKLSDKKLFPLREISG